MMGLYLLMSFFFFFFCAVFLFMSLCMICLNFTMFLQWNFYIGSFLISFPVYLDFFSCFFMFMVLLISGSIIFYSNFYMSDNLFNLRFFYLMMLFVISMIFLILSPNFFCMLLGWDGLGLVSFCLVIFFQNFKAFYSGMITALTNRVGDVFILATISLSFCLGTFNYINLLSLTNGVFLTLFFLIASMTKSAQIPFSSWLPAAMAAPTPVSSLVHSSTLVTAGVYILIRFSYLFEKSFMYVLTYIGLMTMVMAGLCGLLEFDLKKIIAFSTLSQLGFMMATISLGIIDLAFFHLVVHASFKALIFMCAGMFIHNFFNNQDIRMFGLMNKNYNLLLMMFITSNLSLSGFPFLSGFFSKDMILEFMLMNGNNLFLFFLFIFGTFLTVMYTFRMLFNLTFNNCLYSSSYLLKFSKMGFHNSMWFLFFFSIFLGYMGSNLFLMPVNYIVLPFFLKLLILEVCLLSFMVSFFFSFFNYFLKMMSLKIFINKMFFLVYLKTDFLKPFFLFFSSIYLKTLHLFVESNFGQLSASNIFHHSSNLNQSLNLGFYIFMFFFVTFLIFIMMIF